MATLTKEQIETLIDADIDALTAEYTAWNKANGLDLGSADEHLFDDDLTEEQRAWLVDFSERWQQASPYFGNNGMSSRKLDDADEVLLLRGPKEWADFIADNDGGAGLDLSADEALAAAKEHGLWQGGGASPLFFIRCIEG